MALFLKLSATPGDKIEDAAQQMCATANRLHLGIELKFNDVTLRAYPGADYQELVSGYRDSFDETVKHKSVTAF